MPTGNFGDVFAGYLAKKMGLPIDKLIVATNEIEDEQFSKNVLLQRSLGIEVEKLTPLQAKKVVPHLNIDKIHTGWGFLSTPGF